MSEEPPPVPHVAMPTQTLIMEQESQRQLLWVDGFMPLPKGSRLQLTRLDLGDAAPITSDALVQDVRVWGANGPALLVLDVLLIEPGAFTDRP